MNEYPRNEKSESFFVVLEDVVDEHGVPAA
jgi:hypothetical protein